MVNWLKRLLENFNKVEISPKVWTSEHSLLIFLLPNKSRSLWGKKLALNTWALQLLTDPGSYLKACLLQGAAAPGLAYIQHALAWLRSYLTALWTGTERRWICLLQACHLPLSVTAVLQLRPVSRTERVFKATRRQGGPGVLDPNSASSNGPSSAPAMDSCFCKHAAMHLLLQQGAKATEDEGSVARGSDAPRGA